MGDFFHEIWRTYRALFVFFLRFYPEPKTSIWLKKGGSSAQTPILKTSIPALPGLARPCPALRCRKARIQAFSSRAGLQDDARWHPPTPSNQHTIFSSPCPYQHTIFSSPCPYQHTIFSSQAPISILAHTSAQF